MSHIDHSNRVAYLPYWHLAGHGFRTTKGDSMIHAAIIRTDGTASFIEHHPTLSDLQAGVGGLIARVASKHADVWVDDEGLLVGKPINLVASAIGGQSLVGDAVLTGPVDGEGNTTPIIERLVELIRRDFIVTEGVSA